MNRSDILERLKLVGLTIVLILVCCLAIPIMCAFLLMLVCLIPVDLPIWVVTGKRPITSFLGEIV